MPNNILSGPAGYAVIGGVVGLVALFVLRRRTQGSAGKRARSIEDELPEVGKWLKRGEYGRAAAVAAEHNKLAAALELYLRGQQPENAANIALRMHNPKQAAELFERAANWERAANAYEKANMVDKANEIKREKLGQLRAGAKPGEDAIATTRGRALEVEFRKAQALSTGSEADRAKMQSLSRQAADALLADGELRRAADVLRDAELHDEAIHMYVNVLGLPGEAAPILALKGNHERAAELYEMAGESERAASTWVTVAQQAAKPEIFLDRIERLSKDVATTFCEQQTKARPLNDGSAELYYRYATLLAKRGESQRALTVFEQINSTLTEYKDVAAQIQLLVAGKAPSNHGEISQNTKIRHSDASGASGGSGATTGNALSDAQIAALAEQVARAAADQLKRHADLQLARLTAAPALHVGQGAAGPVAAGLESAALQLDLVFDAMVQQARVGPSIPSLQKYIGGRPCDLQNIEVYYRMGLAYLGQGQWQEALVAFDAVEDASPGYRDAWRRADEIRDWQKALGKKRTMLGGLDSNTGATNAQPRYQLHGELGRGGMAVVYRGTDSLLGREVAMKFLSESLSNDAEMKEMFQREARAVAALNHPNIVTIHDVGVLENRAFICMEFVEGKSIESLMLEPPGLTIIESLRAVKQALDGLAYAHQKRIIHRDIKPANMMRTNAGLVKLMDFGLAKTADGKQQQSMIAGTPSYMPLEQIRGDAIDYRVDLFAIGVSLYELLTGVLPYEGLDRQTPPRPLSELVPAIPPMLETMIMAALDNDPQKRPATAEHMIDPINQVLTAVARATTTGLTLAPEAPSAPAVAGNASPKAAPALSSATTLL